MKGQEVLHSKAATGGRDDWLTPPKILEPMREHFGQIGFDVATSTKNPTDAVMIATAQRSGLIGSWILPTDAIGDIAGAYNFANPPYSIADRFVEKAVRQAARGCEIIYLVASRTGAKWFRPCFDSQAIGFVHGRLIHLEAATGKPELDKFGKPMPAPFDSALIYWGHRPALFQQAFGALATVKIFNRPGIVGKPPRLHVA